MASLAVDPHRHHRSAPADLRWKDAVRVDESAAEIMAAAAQRTIAVFAGDSATTVIEMLFGKEDRS